MKALISILALALLLTGCASLEEAYHLDREFGQASQASFNKMVTYPDHRYADQIPEGMEGIQAEGMMKVYDDRYRMKPVTDQIIRLGL